MKAPTVGYATRLADVALGALITLLVFFAVNSISVARGAAKLYPAIP